MFVHGGRLYSFIILDHYHLLFLNYNYFNKLPPFFTLEIRCFCTNKSLNLLQFDKIRFLLTIIYSKIKYNTFEIKAN